MKAKNNNLTIKQEGFAQDFVKFGDASKAYRLNYSASKMKDTTIWSHASRLLANDKVRARVEELKKKVEYQHDIDTKFMIDGYKKAMQMAAAENDSSAFKGALDSLSRFLGNSEAEKVKIQILKKQVDGNSDDNKINITIDV